MVFSDTTNKNGLIQSFEFWTRHQDGEVSGNATLLKIATRLINGGFERLMPMLLAYNDQIRWDDLNHTDAPIGRVNLVADQNDYKLTEDDNSLDILNITKVRILPSSTATVYVDLERLTADDPRVPEILSPDTSVSGTPSAFVELGNVLYLDVLPSYSKSAGIEIFFGREHDYFTSADTTQEPGIPKPFHELLVLHAALDWTRVNRADDLSLLRELKEELSKREMKLNEFISLRNPTKAVMTPRIEPYV